MFGRLATCALFFLSGATGLVYEVVWTRQLSLVFGVSIYAVSTVLATFMGGLAFGSFFFGRWIDKRRNLMSIYAAMEGAIGLYALLVPSLFAALREPYVLLRQIVCSPAFCSSSTLVCAALRGSPRSPT